LNNYRPSVGPSYFYKKKIPEKIEVHNRAVVPEEIVDDDDDDRRSHPQPRCG
jgi:hypothetical protein